MNNKLLGNAGEQMAVEYLASKGYRVLITNYRSKIGEIDVIAEKGSVLAFIEVKTRASLRYGRPSEAVDYRKQQRIIRTALLYVQKYSIDKAVRFDVLEIVCQGDKSSINHIQNAFELHGM